MRRVECIGKVDVGNAPMAFWDTGRRVTPIQLAEITALQYTAFFACGHKLREEARRRIWEKANEIAHQVNVYPVGKAALSDDGRILVTEPYFHESPPA